MTTQEKTYTVNRVTFGSEFETFLYELQCSSHKNAYATVLAFLFMCALQNRELRIYDTSERDKIEFFQALYDGTRYQLVFPVQVGTMFGGLCLTTDNGNVDITIHT
jgi:hypothetical protein